MGHKKTKYDIQSKLFLKDGLQDYADWWFFWDDDDYICECDHCGSYHCRGCFNYYEYLPEEFQPEPKEYVSKRGSRITLENYSTGKLIDMSSIYSKEELRQRKLEAIFGGDYEVFYKKNYFRDLINEKSRNILGKLD